MPVRPVAFVPRVSGHDARLSSFARLLDMVAERKDRKAQERQAEADRRVQLLVDISSQWGPGEWVRHGDSMAQALEAAGHDPKISKLYVDAQKKRSVSRVAPNDAMGRFAQILGGEMAPVFDEMEGPLQPGQDRPLQQVAPPQTLSDAYRSAIDVMGQYDPQGLIAAAPQLKGFSEIVEGDGVEPTSEAKNYSHLRSLGIPHTQAVSIAYDLGDDPDLPNKVQTFEYLKDIVGENDALAYAFGELGREPDKPPTDVEEYNFLISQGIPRDEALDRVWGELRQAGAGGPKFSAGQMRDIQAFRKAQVPLKEIRDLSAKVNTGSGLTARLAGPFKEAAGRLNLANEVELYRTRIRGFVPLFARLLGHTGVLTEIDVARTQELFPTIGDSKSLALAKLDSIERLVREIQEISTKMITGDDLGAQDARIQAQSMLAEIEAGYLDAPPEEVDLTQYEGIPIKQWPIEAIEYLDYVQSQGE